MRVKLKLSASFIVAVLGLLLVPAIAHAQDFRFEASINYDVEANGKAIVTEKYTATNLTNDRVLSSFTVNAPTANISAINARRSSGSKIDVSTETQTATSGDVEYEFTAINLNLKQSPKGKDKSLSFSVSYVVDGLVERVGAGRAIFIPGIASGTEGTSYSVEVKTPLGFGLPKTGADNVSRSGIIGGKQFFSFSGAELADNRIAMLFGDTSVYLLNLKTPIKNNLPWPRTVEATLPPELASQRVYVRSLNPAPANTTLDADGNILARYRLNPFQSLTVETEILIEVKDLKYDLGKSAGFGEVPQSLARYTKATRLWPTDGPVAAKASELADRDEPVITTVENLYNFVVSELKYNATQLNIDPGRTATRPLDVPGQGIVADYSNLLTAMLRSQGVPARTIVGYAPARGLKVGTEPIDSLHTWVEAYVPGVGWMTLDPVWGEKFDHFGLNTAEHIALSVWGEGRGPLPAGGGTGYLYEDMSVTASEEELPQLDLDTLSFAATRYVVLPYLSVDQVKVTGPVGYSTDNFAAQLGERQALVGSLAPGEEKTINRLLFGVEWNKAVPATLAQVVGGESLGELAQTTANVSYVPAIVLAALVVLIILLIAIIRKRKAHKVLHNDKKGDDIERDDIIGDGQEPASPEPTPKPTPIESHQAGSNFTPITPTDAEVEQAAREADTQGAETSKEAPAATRPKNERNYVARPTSIDGVKFTPERIEKLVEDHPHPDPHRPGDTHAPGSSDSPDESETE